MQAGHVIVDTGPQDHESPISEAIRRHSFTGSAVHRPSRTGEHWRRHQAALSSAGSRQGRQSIDGSAGGSIGEHTQEMGSLAGGERSSTGNMAWSVWRNQNGGRGSILGAIAGISLPSAREMNLLFGAKAPEQIPECKPKAVPSAHGTGSYGGLDEDVARQAKVLEKAPIVFLHGVGLGVLPYVGFIRKVLSIFSTDTPIIVPEVCSLPSYVLNDTRSAIQPQHTHSRCMHHVTVTGQKSLHQQGNFSHVECTGSSNQIILRSFACLSCTKGKPVCLTGHKR